MINTDESKDMEDQRTNVEGKWRSKDRQGVNDDENEESSVVSWKTEWRGQEDGDPHDWSL